MTSTRMITSTIEEGSRWQTLAYALLATSGHELERQSPNMICFKPRKSVMLVMPERTQKPPTPAPWEPKQGDGDGPRSPDVSKPDTKDLLKRMRKVDPNQSKRYRQRTGE